MSHDKMEQIGIWNMHKLLELMSNGTDWNLKQARIYLQFNSMENLGKSLIIFSVRDFHSKRCRTDHLQRTPNGIVEYIKSLSIDIWPNTVGELIGCLNKYRNERLQCGNLERIVEKATIMLPSTVSRWE